MRGRCGKKRGLLVDTYVFLVIVAVTLGVLYITTSVVGLVKFYKVKGQLSLAFEMDDKGTELVSLMKAKSGGETYMKILGSSVAANAPADYDSGLKTTLGKIGGYYLILRNQGSESSLKEYASAGFKIDENKMDASGLSLSLPTKPGYYVTGRYGKRTLGGKTYKHEGVDFRIVGNDYEKKPIERDVYPAKDGVVYRVNTGCPSDKDANCFATCSPDATSYACEYWSTNDKERYCNCGGDYGNSILLEHAFGSRKIYTFYGHLEEVYVKEGDAVTTDKAIGRGGNSGTSESTHLHFELREDKSNQINPCYYFTPAVPYSTCMTEDEMGRGSSALTGAGAEMSIPLPGGEKGEVELRVW
jgi:murein DD-endopeptidase MepM/ murein hydrolase activator NlpD